MHPLLVSCLDMPWSLRRIVRIVRNRAVPISALVAVIPRRGSGLAIVLRFILTVVRELDVWTSAATRLRVAGFAAGSHITHVQNCANLA